MTRALLTSSDNFDTSVYTNLINTNANWKTKPGYMSQNQVLGGPQVSVCVRVCVHPTA
jgi:hypothetical protein